MLKYTKVDRPQSDNDELFAALQGTAESGKAIRVELPKMDGQKPQFVVTKLRSAMALRAKRNGYAVHMRLEKDHVHAVAWMEKLTLSDVLEGSQS